MDTETLNINSISGGKEKSEKAGRAKKVANKTAQYTAAAGLGATGTMAANAMANDSQDIETNEEDNSANLNIPSEEQIIEEVTVEAITDFNPNDIMIDVDETVVDDKIEDNLKVDPIAEHSEDRIESVLVEPQPVTMESEDNDSLQELEIIDVNPSEDIVEIESEFNEDPDAWEDLEESIDEEIEIFYADNDDDTDEPDILEDIMA